MSFSGEFIKLTFGWTAEGTDEVAMTSLNLCTDPSNWANAADALDAYDPLTQGASLLVPMATFWGDIAKKRANYGELRSVRAAAVNTSGAEIGDPKIFETTPPVAGADLDVLPQSTIVVSLLSGETTGKGNRGRFYLPYTQFRLQSSPDRPYAVAADHTNTGIAATAFVNALNTAAATAFSAPISVHIMSEASLTPPAGPPIASKRANFVAVGNVTDTQRRRRNKIPELYTSGVVV